MFITEALQTLRAGGPLVILSAALFLVLGLTVIAVSLVRQLRYLGPLIRAWRDKEDHGDGSADDVRISDEIAIEFGTALTSACEVAAIAIDYDHRIRLYNDGAEAMTGWRSEEVMGQDLANLMAAEDARHHGGFVRSYLDRYRAGGPRLAGDVRNIRLLHRDGHVVHARARLIHINRGSQVIFAWLSIAQLES